jgi:1,4-dihydroxy-2-naphthoyl-CoA hydrolase
MSRAVASDEASREKFEPMSEAAAPPVSTGMPFSDLMGVEVLVREKDRIVGRLVVREDLCTAGGILHGGAYMAFADALGALGGVLNLPPGARTTTLESKTNFLRGAPMGSVVTGEATALHIGRRSSVWQTRITNAEGKLMALVTQTQMTVEAG